MFRCTSSQTVCSKKLSGFGCGYPVITFQGDDAVEMFFITSGECRVSSLLLHKNHSSIKQGRNQIFLPIFCQVVIREFFKSPKATFHSSLS